MPTRRLPVLRKARTIQPDSERVNFIRAFDECVIPYKLKAYAMTVVPTKLKNT